MSAIRDRLMASIKIDAINGDTFERSVVRRQILEGIAHIDEQAKQITTLKAICIQERNRYLVDFIHEYDRVMNCNEDARKQLAREYPQIAWEEKK